MAEKNEVRRMSRGWKWVLGLSLALNLLIIGAIGGTMWRFNTKDGGDRRGHIEALASGVPYVRALPRDARRALNRKLRDDRADLPPRSERRALFQQMIETLRADPFDVDAARAILAAQAETAQTVQSRAQAGWLEIVGEMSAEERAEVANRLEEGLKKRRGPGPRKP